MSQTIETGIHSDYRQLAARYHCPQCGRKLHMRHTRMNHTGRDSYRMRCNDPRHWLGPWKPTMQAAYQAAAIILDGQAD